jgi:hypothetical protein
MWPQVSFLMDSLHPGSCALFHGGPEACKAHVWFQRLEYGQESSTRQSERMCTSHKVEEVRAGLKKTCYLHLLGNSYMQTPQGLNRFSLEDLGMLSSVLSKKGSLDSGYRRGSPEGSHSRDHTWATPPGQSGQACRLTTQ